MESGQVTSRGVHNISNPAGPDAAIAKMEAASRSAMARRAFAAALATLDGNQVGMLPEGSIEPLVSARRYDNLRGCSGRAIGIDE